MRYQISEIRLTPEEYRDERNRMKLLEEKVLRKISRSVKGSKDRSADPIITDLTILKESVDARKKPDVRAVFTLAFTCGEVLPLREAKEERYETPAGGELPAERPVIAGFGPCGIFAALILAEAGARPIVLERGKPVDERIADVERFWAGGRLDPESNVQFGEGGAGTFSDGKLTTGIRDIRVGKVLAEFVEGGADPDILYRHRPHIGTDRLRVIVPAMREKIIRLGGEVRFGTRLAGLKTEGGRLTGVIAEGPAGSRATAAGCDGPAGDCGRQRELIPTRHLILAVGHSAEDTFRMLRAGNVAMSAKPFSIGLRIEHPQADIDRAQYGDPDLAKVFGPAEYRLHHRCGNGRGVYTFCMCPGGRVIDSSSGEHQAVTNGMSDRARDGKMANSGLLVDVRRQDFPDPEDPLSGIDFQRKYERLAWENARRSMPDGAGEGSGCGRSLPTTSYGAFKANENDPVRASIPGFAAESILEAMPHLGRKLRGFDREDARLTAVESRSSSPVRIERDDRLNSSIEGLIPAGEGPGYAGGIVSAAVDGIRAAEAVLGIR